MKGETGREMGKREREGEIGRERWGDRGRGKEREGERENVSIPNHTCHFQIMSYSMCLFLFS